MSINFTFCNCLYEFQSTTEIWRIFLNQRYYKNLNKCIRHCLIYSVQNTCLGGAITICLPIYALMAPGVDVTHLCGFGQLCWLLPIMHHVYSALLWQKEASDKSEISCKRAKCVRHFHWCQWNIMMSYLTYLSAGWVSMHKICPGRRAH